MEAVNYGGKRYGYGRRALSFLMALVMVFCMVSSLTISASAATTERGQILSNGYCWVGPQKEFWIKGNLLTRKKVTIGFVGMAVGQGLMFPKAAEWYQKNTRYNVWVLKKDNEHIYEYHCLKYEDTFKLPRGKRDWKIVVQPERTAEFSRGYENVWSFGQYALKY